MSFNRDFIKLGRDLYRRSHLLSRIRSFGGRKQTNVKVLEQDLKELRGVQHQAPLQIVMIS